MENKEVDLIMVTSPSNPVVRDVELAELKEVFDLFAQPLAQDSLRCIMGLTTKCARDQIQKAVQNKWLIRLVTGLYAIHPAAAQGDELQQVGVVVVSLVCALILMLVALILTVRRRNKFVPVAYMPEDYTDFHRGVQVHPESMRAGSTLFATVPDRVPACQCEFRDMTASVTFGNALRFRQYLIVTEHELSSAILTGGFCLIKGDKTLSVKTTDFIATKLITLDADLVAIDLGNAAFSRLGMASARVAPVEGKVMAAVTSLVPEIQASFGQLQNSDVFGMLEYTGSTRAGYSGSAYTSGAGSGTAVYGIHTAGGVVNQGYSMSFIASCLERPEETAVWLEDVRRRGTKIVARRWPGNPSEVQVFVGGQYHVLDLEDVPEWLEIGREGLVPEGKDIAFAYRDFPPENLQAAGGNCDPAAIKQMRAQMMQDQEELKSDYQQAMAAFQDQMQKHHLEYVKQQKMLTKLLEELAHLKTSSPPKVAKATHHVPQRTVVAHGDTDSDTVGAELDQSALPKWDDVVGQSSLDTIPEMASLPTVTLASTQSSKKKRKPTAGLQKSAQQ